MFEFSSLFSWQFSKFSKKIAKRNDFVCNDLVVGTGGFVEKIKKHLF